jgi:hypothetical protein
MEKVQAKHKATAAILAVSAVAAIASGVTETAQALSRQNLEPISPVVAAYIAAGVLAAVAIVGTGSIVVYALAQDDKDVAGLREERTFEASQLPPSRTVLTPVNRVTRTFARRPAAQSAHLRLARSA